MPQRSNSFASATPLGPVEYADRARRLHRAPERVLAADLRPGRAGRHRDRDARAREVDLAAGDEVLGGEQLVDGVGREHHDVERLAGLHAPGGVDAADGFDHDHVPRTGLVRVREVGEHGLRRHRRDAADRSRAPSPPPPADTASNRSCVVVSASSARLEDAWTTRPRSRTIGLGGQLQRQAGVLLHQHQRQPAVLHHPPDRDRQLLDEDRREPLHRLVEQQHPRVQRQRATDRQHLLLAAGQLVAVVAAALLQARKQLEHARRVPVAIRARPT